MIATIKLLSRTYNYFINKNQLPHVYEKSSLENLAWPILLFFCCVCIVSTTFVLTWNIFFLNPPAMLIAPCEGGGVASIIDKNIRTLTFLWPFYIAIRFVEGGASPWRINIIRSIVKCVGFVWCVMFSKKNLNNIIIVWSPIFIVYTYQAAIVCRSIELIIIK